MNIYKKLTAVFLVMLMLVSIVPAQCFAAAEPEQAESSAGTQDTTDEENTEEENTVTLDGIIYQLSDEEAYIVGCEDLSGNIELPSEVEGLPVTKICRKAFESNQELTGVVIPEAVTEIEDYAFIGCSNLHYIRILGNRVNVGFQAFLNTAAYQAQKKPNEPNYLDGYLLNCDNLDYSVRDITVKPGTRGVAKQAFSYITNLRKVRFPMSDCHIYDSTQTMNRNLVIYGQPGSTAEEYAEKYSRTFLPYCTHPEKKEYPETETTCTSIGYTAGVGCEACGEWFSGHEIKTEIHHRDENGDGVCDDCQNTVTGITRSGKCGELAYFIYYNDQSVIIDGRGAVNSYTFRNAEDIKKLTVNEGITAINEYAFVADVFDLTLPDSLVTLGDNAFSYLYVQSLTLPENLVYLGKGVLGGSTIESLSIGKNLETIGGNLSGYSNLKEITVSPDNRFYSSDENGVLFNKDQSVLLSYPCGKTDKEYTVPETVRYIADKAFNGAKLEKVVLPEFLEEIGSHAFYYCQEIKHLDLPQSLRVISDSAFYMCRRLDGIVLPENLSVLGSHAFDNAGDLAEGGIGTLRIPGNIRSVGDYAFRQCGKVTTLILEEGIREIGAGAFYHLDVTRVEIPASVVSMGYMAFAFCWKMKEFILVDGIEKLGNGVLRACSGLEKITLPDSITHIGFEAFYDCRNLAEINFPESLVSIGAYAFESCWSLAELNFNDGLESIGEGAFYNCYKLSSVAFNQNLEFIGAKAFYNCSGLESVRFNDSLQTIWDYAFVGTALKGKLVFPSGLQTIRYKAFYNLTNIESIEFNDGLTTIGDNAFSSLPLIESVVIPDSVTTLGSSAFSSCTNLQSVRVGKGVNKLSSYTFANDVSLKSVTLQEGLSAIDFNAFFGCTGLVSLEIPQTVSRIDRYAFSNCTSLESINLPEGIALLNSNVFAGCSALTQITIPDSVTEIGYQAFYNCTSLRTVNFGKNVRKIGYNAFNCCTSLNQVELPEALVKIDQYAFSESGLTEITLPSSCETIENNCFYNCKELRKATLNEGLTFIGGSAFNATAIREITLPSTVKTLSRVFSGNKTIEKVVIGNGTQVIDIQTFSDTTALRQVVIPDSVRTLGTYVFQNCASLEEITLPDNINKIAKTSFDNCANLTQIKVNKNSVTYNKLLAAGIDEKLLVCRHDGKTPENPSSGECPSDYECPHCGEKLTQYHQSHSAVTDPSVAPTCHEAGLTEGSHCSVCGKVLQAQQVIPKLSHTVVIDKAVEPTCSNTGLTEGSHCAVCGKVLAGQKTLARTYHKIVADAAVAPTGTDPGLTEGSHCSVCGLIIVRQEVVDCDEYSIITNASNSTVTAKQVIKATQTANGNIKKVVFFGKGKSAINETKIYKIGKVSLSETTYTYDGKTHRPKVTVRDSRDNEIPSKFYTLSYSNANAKYPGKYTVSVTFKGNYSGKKSLSFTIKPARVSGVKAVSPSKKTATVSFTKAVGVSGYEIYYSTNKDKGYKKLTGTTKTSYTYKKFTSGKTLYFKVRAYKTVGTDKIYGGFSTPKSLKIK